MHTGSLWALSTETYQRCSGVPRMQRGRGGSPHPARCNLSCHTHIRTSQRFSQGDWPSACQVQFSQIPKRDLLSLCHVLGTVIRAESGKAFSCFDEFLKCIKCSPSMKSQEALYKKEPKSYWASLEFLSLKNLVPSPSS